MKFNKIRDQKIAHHKLIYLEINFLKATYWTLSIQ